MPKAVAAWLSAGSGCADHTTLRLGGPAAGWSRATTEDELVDAVAGADAAGEPVLVLGGGSNLVVADEGFDGTVVRGRHPRHRADVEDDDPTCGGVMVTVAAGETWDDLVAHARSSAAGSGVEALSGIPGSVGATPIQNVGAYGQEVSQTIASVRVWDRALQRRPHLRRRRLRLRLPHQPVQGRPRPPRRARGDLPAPRRATSARPVRVRRAGPRPRRRARASARRSADVREAVLGAAPRQGHGARRRRPRHLERRVVLHQPGRRRPTPCPRAPRPGRSPTARVKTSAAWLIEHAGFGKGYGDGPVAPLDQAHAGADQPRAAPRTADLLALAREVRDGVERALRHPAGQRAGAGRLRALSAAQTPGARSRSRTGSVLPGRRRDAAR